MILVLRYGRKPGVKNGRPLVHQGYNFWLLTDDYLLTETYTAPGKTSKREE